MMEMQEKSQADFDIERMFDMLDTALTSKDERVQSALRALLTIIALTKTQEDGRYAIEDSNGPLRQMREDLNALNRRFWNLQEQVNQMNQASRSYPPPYPTGLPAQPYTNPGSPYSPSWGATPNPWSTTTTWAGQPLDEKVEK